ncbi:MAG: DNA polymerase Y family protein [Acetobacteraceae bacterium]|nr:DNA polymerase Y family protein [Acetobacteraceae bacterium]
MRRRRFLALHLPCLSTDRLARLEPALRDRPLAVWAGHAGRRTLVAVNAEVARQLGVDLPGGLPLADAIAMCPGLVTRAADPAADALLLARLARWAVRYTPLVAPAGDEALVLDISGCTHLFGGEAALLADAARRLARFGLSAGAAIAGTAAASLALARAGRHGAIVAAGEELAALAPLPLAALEINETLRARLEKFGITDIATLAGLPRAALARRAGGAALAALDLALGRAAAPLGPLAPPAGFAATLEFAEPILTPEAIRAALARLLDELCARLAEAGRGARRLSLSCHRLDRDVQRIGIGTSLSVRDPRHLERLFRDRLERLAPGFGIERMVLAADVSEPLEAVQSAFDAGLVLRAGRRAELGRLVDRLRGRLGPRAVHGLALAASHVPERAVVPVEPFSPMPSRGAGTSPGPMRRPVRLFEPPEPVSVLSLLPDGPPRRLCWRNRVIGIARAEGPERIAAEWWREPDRPARDYWRVEAEGGGRLWLYRTDPAAWFLHGLFA